MFDLILVADNHDKDQELLTHRVLHQKSGHAHDHVKNSYHFIQILETLQVQPEDLMVSFDVVSLFTKVPVVDSLSLLSHHFRDGVLALFKHVLTSTYFCHDGQFYEQTDGVAMGSPLSLVIANFFMQDFEEKAIEQVSRSRSLRLIFFCVVGGL